jgi:hypothetical protein
MQKLGRAKRHPHNGKFNGNGRRPNPPNKSQEPQQFANYAITAQQETDNTQRHNQFANFTGNFQQTSKEVGRTVGITHREEVEITDCKDREEDLETQDQGSIVRCVV